MQYFYAMLWFIVGLVLVFSMSKENKIFILAGGFFLFLGAWWLADALLPDVNLFDGGWGIALKCVTGAALVILVVCFAREYRKNTRGKGKDSQKKE